MKQQGNGRQQFSSHWLACRTKLTARIHWLSHTMSKPVEDNRITRMALKRASCAGLGKEGEKL
jgi:hypothetical protein